MRFAAARNKVINKNVFSDIEKDNSGNSGQLGITNKVHHHKEIDIDSGNIAKQFNISQEVKMTVGGKITLRAIPYFFWFIGILFLAVAFLLFINLLMGIGNDKEDLSSRKKTIFNAYNEGLWWQYLIVILIFLLGLSFFVIAKYETIIVDKDNNKFILTKTYLLCCKEKVLELHCSDIESIFAFKTGKVTSSTSSILYKLGIRFRHNNKSNCVYVFKSIFEKFVVDDVKTIREFLYEMTDDYETIKDEMRNGIDYS